VSKKSQADHKAAKELFNSKCVLQNINGEVHSVATVYSDDINPFNKDLEPSRHARFERWWDHWYEQHCYFEDIFDVMGGRPLVSNVDDL
jgi:hypothetical protein